MDFLYADGHVRVYHGKHAIPKAHVARMHIAMPGTSDYWVNNAGGEPLFVVTAEAGAVPLPVLRRWAVRPFSCKKRLCCPSCDGT